MKHDTRTKQAARNTQTARRGATTHARVYACQWHVLTLSASIISCITVLHAHPCAVHVGVSGCLFASHDVWSVLMVSTFVGSDS